MRKLSTLLLAAALLVGLAATAQASLLEDVTNGSSHATAMTSAELDSVVGEGTISRFVEVPNLARDFERTIEIGPNTISITAVAGSGITITFDGPDVPDL